MSKAIESPMVTKSQADSSVGKLFSIKIILSSTPGKVTILNIPDFVIGIGLYTYQQDITFAIDEDPEEEKTSNATTIEVNDYSIGTPLLNCGQWEYRVLEERKKRTLRVRGKHGNEEIHICTFG
jgi:hypothetical protein